MDSGLPRTGIGYHGAPTGAHFEATIVVEIHKWLSTAGHPARAFFYRTRSGMEVDLLLETPQGLVGLEIKQRSTPSRRDLRGLIQVCDAAGAEWVGGVLVTDGEAIECLDEARGLWAVPVHRLLTPAR